MSENHIRHKKFNKLQQLPQVQHPGAPEKCRQKGKKTSYLNRMFLKSQNKIRLKGELYGQRNLKDSPKSETQLSECMGACMHMHTHAHTHTPPTHTHTHTHTHPLHTHTPYTHTPYTHTHPTHTPYTHPTHTHPLHTPRTHTHTHPTHTHTPPTNKLLTG